jgi:hypothetical protein
MSDVRVLWKCLLLMYIHVYMRGEGKKRNERQSRFFLLVEMFGFPTDLFGMPGGDSRRVASHALVPHQQSSFGNPLMIPSPFAGMNGMFDTFGMHSSPFAMMEKMMEGMQQHSHAPMHSFTSTTVMSFSGADGRPKVYQESTSHSRGPGGMEETRQSIRDSARGINKVRHPH